MRDVKRVATGLLQKRPIRYNGQVMAADKSSKLFQAEYMGSGTFKITKPKRKKKKLRQTRVKNVQRGARK